MNLGSDTVLLVIDVQKAFEHPSWGARNNPAAEENISSLLASWRERGMPIFHIQHRNPQSGSHFNPGSQGIVVKPEAQPKAGEPVIFKEVHSAFIGTDLYDRLRKMKTTTVVLVGITTDHCVSTTTRMAGNYGFEAFVVSDATATFERTGSDGRHFDAQLMHESALASLNGAFATVVSTSEVLAAVPEAAKSER